MHIRNPMEWLFAQLDVTAGLGSAAPKEYWPVTHAAATPVVQKITRADLRYAFRRGLHDFSAARTDIVFLFIVYPVVVLFAAGAATHQSLLPLLFPIASGFALLGPFFAVGLYEMSRDREMTGKISWFDTFKVLRSPAFVSIVLLGFLLVCVFLAWLGVAQAIYDFTLGPLPPVSTLHFLSDALTTPAGWAMILIGSAVGAVFAIFVLAIAVVSFPLLLDRPVGFATAIATSISAVRHNPITLASWGLFVAITLIVSAIPCFIGLIVALPVLGHATWHLYRQIVKPPVFVVS
jgi:uncharacterized membrane protein